MIHLQVCVAWMSEVWLTWQNWQTQQGTRMKQREIFSKKLTPKNLDPKRNLVPKQSIKNWMGPYQRTPRRLLELFNTQFRGPFSGSCWRFLGNEEHNLVPKRTDEETVRLPSIRRSDGWEPAWRQFGGLGSFWSKPLKMEHPALIEHRGIFQLLYRSHVIFLGGW